MKKLLQDRLTEIWAKIDALPKDEKDLQTTVYQILNAQASLIIGIMNEYEGRHTKVITESIMTDWNMGIISKDELNERLNNIPALQY